MRGPRQWHPAELRVIIISKRTPGQRIADFAEAGHAQSSAAKVTSAMIAEVPIDKSAS